MNNKKKIPTNPYDALVAAGCKIDSHESDLYVKLDEKAVEIVKASAWPNTSTFKSEVDGKFWIDLPFAFKPFWDKKPKYQATGVFIPK